MCASLKAMPDTSTLLDKIGAFVARKLTRQTSGYEPYAASRPELTAITLRPCDVLLVEGSGTKVSSTIRYLTQSTWSHAALYVGLGAGLGERDGEPLVLVEAELGHGVIASPLSKYATYNTRICRPIGLTPEDRAAVIRYAVERIGHRYDLKNIIDLLRFSLRPPVPSRWRRRMLALGSGDPTRAICTTLIAQAFESCVTRCCRISNRTMPKAAGKSCISVTIRCSRRAISTCRRFSRSSSRPLRPDSITSVSNGPIKSRSRKRADTSRIRHKKSPAEAGPFP